MRKYKKKGHDSTMCALVGRKPIIYFIDKPLDNMILSDQQIAPSIDFPG